jgi:hypothetical protein
MELPPDIKYIISKSAGERYTTVLNLDSRLKFEISDISKKNNWKYNRKIAVRTPLNRAEVFLSICNKRHLKAPPRSISAHNVVKIENFLK